MPVTVKSASAPPAGSTPPLSAQQQQQPQPPPDPSRLVTFSIQLCPDHLAGPPVQPPTADAVRKFTVSVIECAHCGPGDPVYAAVIGVVQLLATGHLRWDQLQAMVAEAQKRMPPGAPR